jgi:DNA-directed RNA polymerase subunit RPC12/RpoP
MSDPAPERVKVRNFPCKGCGASVEWTPAAQSLQCPKCGNVEKIPETEDEIREYSFNDYLGMPKSRDGFGVQGKTVRCDRCSAAFQVEETQISMPCRYCGAPMTMERAEIAQQKISPEAILPFQVGKPAAEAAVKGWLRSRWFAPNALSKESSLSRLQGVYRPYWTFDAMTSNHYSGYRGDYYYVGSGKNRRREIRWTFVSGSFQRFFDDVLISAGRGLDFETEFPLPRCEPFRPEFMSGWTAETYSLEPEAGWQRAKDRIRRWLYEEAERRIGGDRQRDVNVTTAFSGVSFKHLLLPVYIGLFEYRKKLFPIQVNGATAEVKGKRPYSFWKIFFAVLAGLVLVAGLILLWASNQ